MERIRAWWRGASPLEQRAVMFGVPIVVLLAAVAIARGRARAESERAAAEAEAADKAGSDGAPSGTLPGSVTGSPSMGAIGVGQLADFESSFTEALHSQGEALAQQQEAINASIAAQLDTLRSDVDDRIDSLPQTSNPPAADPQEPPPEPQPVKAQPMSGYDYVRDNIGAEFVVQWGAQRRYRLAVGDRPQVRAAFGAPKTTLGQVPVNYRNAVLEWFASTGRDTPTLQGPIYLDARIWPWQESNWTGQGIST